MTKIQNNSNKNLSKTEVVEGEIVDPTVEQNKNVNIAKKEKNDKSANKKAKKEKKPGLGAKLKATSSELKKVTWPTFAKAVKKTGVVLGFVLISALVLLGIDKLLSLLFDWLVL